MALNTKIWTLGPQYGHLLTRVKQLGTFVIGILLVACEAPLDLSGVEAQLALPTQRTDLFQAAARHDDEVVTVGGMGTIVMSDDGGENWQRSTLLVLAITLHNIPEGLAVGVAFGAVAAGLPAATQAEVESRWGLPPSPPFCGVPPNKKGTSNHMEIVKITTWIVL